MSTRLVHGDCREVLKTLPDESVHCVVTSPPYFGLRDYGTGQWTGGDPSCGHFQSMARRDAGRCSDDTRPNINQAPVETPMLFRDLCGLCGARRTDSQIGLQLTPDAYVAEMVAVFREVRRVLRDDGTLWLNLGDSYSSGGRTTQCDPSGFTGQPKRENGGASRVPVIAGIKPKDMIGIPWMVAFALRADGWYLRQDIIWSKPNPVPESVRDRCTKAHEYLFLLSKSARYFWDAEAIAEPSIYAGYAGDLKVGLGSKGFDPVFQRTALRGERIVPETRNKRSVWEVATRPFSEAHFATFPPALIEPCIKAGCPVGGTVLDPFAGAGTTGLVADRLGRNAILIELNSSYADMSKRRLVDDAPLFVQVTTAA